MSSFDVFGNLITAGNPVTQDTPMSLGNSNFAPISSQLKQVTTPQPGIWDSLKGGNTNGSIMGMSPNSFAAIAGGMGQALSTSQKGVVSPMGKIGGLAASLGQAQLAAIAADKQHKANGALLSTLFTKMGDAPQIKSMMDKINGMDNKIDVKNHFGDEELNRLDAVTRAGGSA